MNRARFLVDSQGVVTDRYANRCISSPTQPAGCRPHDDSGYGYIALAFVVGFLILAYHTIAHG